jgi:hypothetical protein
MSINGVEGGCPQRRPPPLLSNEDHTATGSVRRCRSWTRPVRDTSLVMTEALQVPSQLLRLDVGRFEHRVADPDPLSGRAGLTLTSSPSNRYRVGLLVQVDDEYEFAHGVVECPRARWPMAMRVTASPTRSPTSRRRGSWSV